MQSAEATWNDERLNELSARVGQGFTDLRTEFRDLRASQEVLRQEIKSGDESLRAEIRRFGGALLVGLLIAVLTGEF